jgi:hypothetical protein
VRLLRASRAQCKYWDIKIRTRESWQSEGVQAQGDVQEDVREVRLLCASQAQCKYWDINKHKQRKAGNQRMYKHTSTPSPTIFLAFVGVVTVVTADMGETSSSAGAGYAAVRRPQVGVVDSDRAGRWPRCTATHWATEAAPVESLVSSPCRFLRGSGDQHSLETAHTARCQILVATLHKMDAVLRGHLPELCNAGCCVIGGNAVCHATCIRHSKVFYMQSRQRFYYQLSEPNET